MIKLTREEALEILMALSRFDGFVMSLRGIDSSAIVEELDAPVKILTKKLAAVAHD